MPEWAEYLQVPADLPERVKQLALDITKTASNPYDKAKLIEKYLSEHYPYTNTPDETKGKSKDFVDRFLFEVKQGYCDYYSTAMAVLTRSTWLADSMGERIFLRSLIDRRMKFVSRGS